MKREKAQFVKSPYQVKENEKENKTDVTAEVKTEIKRVGDEIKNMAEDFNKKLKAGGDASTEMKATVDTLLTTKGEMETRLGELEQKLARRPGSEKEVQKSIGEMFVANEEYKAFAQGVGKRSYHQQFKAIISSLTTDAAGSAGDAVRPERLQTILEPGLRRLTVRDLLTPGRTSSNAIEYVKETGFTNNAAVQAETISKGNSDLKFDLITTPVATIAHYVRASKQILDDAPMMQSYIDGRLRYGLALKEEDQLLNGSGQSGNINGVYTQATAYSAPAGITVEDQTIIDTLRLALLQAELAEFPSTGLVLNPINWAGIELTKDGEGRYIIGNPTNEGTPRLWGRPVVPTPAMTVDKFLAGAFKLGAQVFDRELANVLVSTEDQDNFIKNLVTIRAEERLALAVYRTEAFIKGDFGIIT